MVQFLHIKKKKGREKVRKKKESGGERDVLGTLERASQWRNRAKGKGRMEGAGSKLFLASFLVQQVKVL